MKNLFVAVTIMASSSIFAQTEVNQPWKSGRPDGHAPISVMADHTHGKGDWMFSYRSMFMDMKGIKEGSSDSNEQNVLENYMVSPVKMSMKMHMLGAMYAPSDKVTLMAMTNYLSNTMDHINRMGNEFNVKSSGFGDISISALYKIINRNRQTIHSEIGISLPTGSTEETAVTPASAPNAAILPYAMQTGSGTVDGKLGLTYLGQSSTLSWGTQFRTTLRFGKNDMDYRLGNQYQLNTWLAYKANNWLSVSTKIQGLIVDNIKGENTQLSPMMVSTADNNNYGGNHINSGIGLNTYIPQGTLKDLRFGLEYIFPLYQDLNGVQLKQKQTLVFGIQYSFN